jgi:MFS family permease
LIGAPIGAIAFGLIPVAAVLPLFVACTSTLLLSMAFWRTPVVALMPDITPSQFRSQSNGIINLMGGVGAIIAFLGGSKLYDINPAFPFWLGSALVIISSVLLFIFIKEPKVFIKEGEEQPSMLKSLNDVMRDPDKSALRILLAIFFWFVAYSAVEAFFSLYAVNRLGMGDSDGPRLLGQLSLLFVIFAIPAGIIGARIGRRLTISIGIILMAGVMLAMYLSPVSLLTQLLATLPVLGKVPVVGILLMVAGASWSLININSLPMVVDMTDTARLGTYTGLYYLFSTLSAIVGPNLNGWIIEFSGRDYNSIMLVAPLFMLIALVLMTGVRKGESAHAVPAVAV